MEKISYVRRVNELVDDKMVAWDISKKKNRRKTEFMLQRVKMIKIKWRPIACEVIYSVRKDDQFIILACLLRHINVTNTSSVKDIQ